MIKAYFDESGINPSESVTSVAGLVAESDGWLAADDEWRAMLSELEIDYFHMVDCENGVGQFAKYADRPEFRLYAVRRFSEIIKTNHLFSFWAAVPRESWDEAADDTIMKRYPKPYYLCFDRCIRAIDGWSADLAEGARVAVVHSDQLEYEPHAQDVFLAYKRTQEESLLINLSFAPMRQCAPLQAADMLSYSVNKDLESGIYGKEKQHGLYKHVLDRVNESGPLCGKVCDVFTLDDVKASLNAGRDPWVART